MKKLMLLFKSCYSPRLSNSHNTSAPLAVERSHVTNLEDMTVNINNPEMQSSSGQRVDAVLSTDRPTNLPNENSETLNEEALINELVEQNAAIARFVVHSDDPLNPDKIKLKPRSRPRKRRSTWMIAQKMVQTPHDAANVVHHIPQNIADFVLDMVPHGNPVTTPYDLDEVSPPDVIVYLLADENGYLPALMDGGQHTRFTYYAARNRLDVVKAIFRHPTPLSDVISIRSPAPNGRTCLYWFAAWCNLEGVKLCVLISDSTVNGWSAAVMTVVHVAASQPLGQREYRQFLADVLQQMAAALPNAVVANALNDCRLDWSTLCPWLMPQDSEQSVLHYACQRCQLDQDQHQRMLQLLVQHGADPMLPMANATYRSSFDVCGWFQSDPVIACRLLIELCRERELPWQNGVAHLLQRLQVRRIAAPVDLHWCRDREL